MKGAADVLLDPQWVQQMVDRCVALGALRAANEMRTVKTWQDLRYVMGIEKEWPDVVLEDILDAEVIGE